MDANHLKSEKRIPTAKVSPWPLNYLQTTLHQARFWVHFLFAILSKYKPSNFPQILCYSCPFKLVKKSESTEKFFYSNRSVGIPTAKRSNQNSRPEIGNSPIQAFVAPTRLH